MTVPFTREKGETVEDWPLSHSCARLCSVDANFIHGNFSLLLD
jgi:hypothetical protein